MGKMREMTEELTVSLFSDGWTVVNHHPIISLCQTTRVGVLHDVSDSESESENESDKIYVSCGTEGIRLFVFNIWSSTLFLFSSSTFFCYI